MKALTEYDTQAQEFLDRFGLRLKIELSDTKTADWDEDPKPRHHYKCTLARRSDYAGNQNLRPKSASFDFFGSIADYEQNTHPTAYDVLACISGDVHCPETFEDFCSEYGYDTDSRKAEKTFKQADSFARRLRAFLTPSEQEAIAEIQ